MLKLRKVHITRYITPLREGGSMPALVEADDNFKYVIKFRGAGQGTNALIAELIGGEIARFLGFKVPEIVFADLDEGFGRTEPDEEIQDLLKFSVGNNLGLHYLSGSITFDPAVNKLSPKLSSEIVWLDALLMNMDRTCKNTNMLMWNKELWLIDHGASLYFHHSWTDYEQQAAKPFSLIKDHVLLENASLLKEVNEAFSVKLSLEKVNSIIDLIPDDFLSKDFGFESFEAHRNAYKNFFKIRLENINQLTDNINYVRKNNI